MTRLTKEQLLAFAHHSSQEVSNAYKNRIFEELLKSQDRLISFEDIKFIGENAFNADEFYQGLADKIRNLKVSDKRSLWTLFFDIVRQDKENIPAVYAAICQLYTENGVTTQVKDRCLNYLSSIKKTSIDGKIICALLKNAENERFQSLSLCRVGHLDKYCPEVILSIANLPSNLFEFQLNLCKTLLRLKIEEQNAGLAKILVNGLMNHSPIALLGNSKEDLRLARLLCEAQELLVQALEDFISNKKTNSLVENILSLENSKSLTTENTVKVFCSILDNAPKDSADYFVTCSLEALNILAPRVPQTAEKVYVTLVAAMSFKSFYVKNLALLVISSTYPALDPESKLAEDYCLLYASNIGNLRHARHDIYTKCFVSWMLQHKPNFLLTVKNVPLGEEMNMLDVAAKHCYWSEAFTAFSWNEFKDISALMLGLIDLSQYCPLARVAITESVKEIASLHTFKENEALEIRLQLFAHFWFDDIQIKDDATPLSEVNYLLALLND